MLRLVAYISVLLYSSQDTEKKFMLVLQLFLVSPEHWWHIYDEIEEQKASSTLLFSLLYFGTMAMNVSSFPFKCTEAFFPDR